MKKVIIFLVSATCALLMFTGCPNAGNSDLPDDVLSASDASSLYNNLLGTASNDLLNPSNLVVYDKNNKATEIEQSNNSRATETSTWQPLKKDVTVINPRDEILFCSSLDYSLILKQDKGNNYSSKTLATMSTYSHDRMIGDYDNDGLDEVCIFYLVYNDSENKSELQYNIYDNDSLSALAKLDTQNGDTRITGASVVGDYDGDGKDEIIVPIGSSLFLYDYENSSLTLKQKYDLTGYQILEIISGDYDGDGISDFIIKLHNTSSDSYGYKIFSGVFNVFGQFGSVITDEISAGTNFWTVDVDADGCDEFCLEYYKNLNYCLNTYKISKSTIALLSEKSTGTSEQICDIVDINGDLSPELITVDTSGGHNYKMYYEQKFDGKYYSAKDLSLIRTFGDIDDNGTTDLISLSQDSKQIVVYGYNTLTKAFEKLQTYDLGKTEFGSLVAGNFDNDSSRVQFVSHELCFSEPIVRAVIASVPYYEGLVGTGNYDPSSWNTGYEISKTTSSSFENEEGFHVKISGGAEFKVFGNGAKFDLSLDNSFKWACSSSMSVGSSVGYYNGGGENLVVFTAAPVDVYSYKILACPYDESLVGTTTTINIPRKVSTYSTELNYYNAHNGSFADIPDTVFTHTIGVPSSYRSNEVATTFINDKCGFISPSPSGVSISDTGSSSFSLSYGTEKTKTFTHEEARDVSVEVAASGITGGLEAGFAFGLSWSDSIVKGNTFTGTVGNIPLSIGANGNYPTYTSGLYVYKKVVFPGGSELVLPPGDSVLEEYIQRCEGLVFWVVDYFVN